MRRAGGVACRWGRRPIEFTVGQRLAEAQPLGESLAFFGYQFWMILDGFKF